MNWELQLKGPEPLPPALRQRHRLDLRPVPGGLASPDIVVEVPEAPHVIYRFWQRWGWLGVSGQWVINGYHLYADGVRVATIPFNKASVASGITLTLTGVAIRINGA